MNTFVPNAPFLYPLKTSENLTVFELRTNGLININNYCTHFIKLAGWQLSGVVIGWMKIFSGGNLLCENYPGGNFLGRSFPGWELSRWDLSWVGIFFGVSFPGGNCLVGIIRVAIFRVGVFMLRKTATSTSL